MGRYAAGFGAVGTDPQAWVRVVGDEWWLTACGSVARSFWERVEDGLCVGDELLLSLGLHVLDVLGDVGLSGPAGEVELVWGGSDAVTQ